MAQITFAPGAVAANTNIDVPSGSPSIAGLTKVTVYNSAQYTQVADIAHRTPTIVTTVPGAGEARLIDTNTIELGDAVDAFDIITLDVVETGQYLQVS